MKNLFYLFIILISLNRCDSYSSSKKVEIISSDADDYVAAAKKINDIYNGPTKFQRHFTNDGIVDSLMLTVKINYSDSTCDYLGEAIARNIAFEFVNNINFFDQKSIKGITVKLRAKNSIRKFNLEKEILTDWDSQIFVAEKFISNLFMQEDYSDLLNIDLKKSNFKLELDSVIQFKKSEFGEIDFTYRFGLIKYHSSSLDKKMSNIWFLVEHAMGHYLIEISLGLEMNNYKIYGSTITDLIVVKNKTKPNKS